MIQKILLKLAPVIGLNHQEAEWFWGKVADRLHDLEVLMDGGTLRSGKSFPGLVKLSEQIKKVYEDVDHLKQVIDVEPRRINGVPVKAAPPSVRDASQQEARPVKKGSR